MEASPCSASIKGPGGRKALASPPVKDLWAAVQSGTAVDVDAALASLKKNNGSVDVRNAFGSTALHIAVWRNHIPIMRRLLAAGADTDIRVSSPEFIYFFPPREKRLKHSLRFYLFFFPMPVVQP
jgi:hypothetical protein